MNVDLWIANLNEIEDLDQGILSREEKRRVEKFIYPKHKMHFIKRRVLLRKLAAEYLGISPKGVGFGYGKLGKPFIAMSKEKLHFNLSHSRDQVIYGFSREENLGVDIEFIDPEIEAELISDHFFSSDEISAIKAAKGTARAEVFFRHWCIKEAYIKFVGKGLTMPLDQVLVRRIHKDPYLEIFSRGAKASKEIHSLKFLNPVSGYGVAVLVDAEMLDVKVRNWGG